MMLDSAAELLLHCEWDPRLRWAGDYRELVRMARRAGRRLAALTAFADLEDVFEPVEALVMQLLTEVEVRRDLASGR